MDETVCPSHVGDPPDHFLQKQTIGMLYGSRLSMVTCMHCGWTRVFMIDENDNPLYLVIETNSREELIGTK